MSRLAGLGMDERARHTGRTSSIHRLRPKAGDQWMTNVALTCDFAIRPLRPFFITQKHHHGATLVRIRAAQHGLSVGAYSYIMHLNSNEACGS